MKIPFVGQAYESRSLNVNAQTCLNLYPEIDQKDAKNVIALYPTPGLTEVVTAGLGPTRSDGIEFQNSSYWISGGALEKIDSSFTVTEIGTLNTSGGNVSMAQNGSQLMIVDGTNGYIYSSTYSTFAQIKQYSTGTTDGTTTDKLVDSGATFVADGVKAGTIVYNTTDTTTATITAVDSETTLSVSSDIFVSGEAYEVGTSGFPDGATHVVFIDGYFIVNNPGTGQFHISSSYQGTAWNALDFANAERNPDDIKAIAVNHRELWLFGRDTAEVWFNSGAEFPFDPVQQGFSEWGIAAPFSVSTLNGSLFWLTSNERGEGLIAFSQGYTPKIISTRAIEAEISGYSQISDAISYTYQQQGHHFYVLTFPVANKTWVYDVATEMWHERGTHNIGRHRSCGHLFFANTHLVGDYATGKIFKLDLDVYTDDGALIERIRRTQHLHKDLKRIIYHVLQVDMETGVGLVTGQGNDPQVMLRWSDDGGHTWSSEIWRSMGKIGEYNTRTIWRRLGKSRDRIFELKVTDPVKTVVIDARADLTVCTQ